MATPLSVYPTATVCTILSTANKLYTVSGAPTNQENLVKCGTSTGYGELVSQGTTNAWAGAGSLPAQSGGGWFLDSSLLDNQQLLAGSFTGSIKSGYKTTGNTGTAFYYQRWSKYTAATTTYTTIVVLSSTSQSMSGSTAITVAVSGTNAAAVNFSPGDYLYIDEFVNFTANTGSTSQTLRLGNLSLDTTTFTGLTAHSGTSNGYQVGVTTSSQSVTELNAIVESIQSVASTTTIESIGVNETTSIVSLTAILEAIAVVETVSFFNVFLAVVTELNAVVESVKLQASATITDANPVVESVKLQSSYSVAESIAVSETVQGIAIFLAVVSEANAVTEVVRIQASTSAIEAQIISEIVTLLSQSSTLEANPIIETVVTAQVLPIPVDTSAQMLYDTLQQQYARLRSSTTNSHIQIIGIVYFPPAQILSEHSIPGELDVLLIGETYSQVHILRTIDDVTAFIAANP